MHHDAEVPQKHLSSWHCYPRSSASREVCWRT
ncbi:hypothetical protein CsSME_00001969 [Camellia sinensis var. sinensis]